MSQKAHNKQGQEYSLSRVGEKRALTTKWWYTHKSLISCTSQLQSAQVLQLFETAASCCCLRLCFAIVPTPRFTSRESLFNGRFSLVVLNFSANQCRARCAGRHHVNMFWARNCYKNAVHTLFSSLLKVT